MKIVKIVILMFFASIFDLAVAQALRPVESSQIQNHSAKRIVSVKSFISSATASQSKAEAIESLYGASIEASNENVDELGQMATSSAPIDERVPAIRVLALLYNESNSAALNESIKAKLRELSQSNNKDIAVAALLRYTRLQYSADLENLLSLNYQRGFIDNDDLQGELAHIFPFAPESDQVRILKKIDQGGSEYAYDILASNFKEAVMRAKLSKNTKLQLIGVLTKRQPGFSVAIGEFSLKEAIVYSDWLHTLASLNAEVGLKSYEDTVLEQLSGDFSNPKRAISFLSSPEGKLAAVKIGLAKLNPTFGKITRYAESLPYPQNSAIRDYASNAISLKLKMH